MTLTRRTRFASLVIDLIPDVQILVLCQMDLADLLSFRLVCRGFHSIVNCHQSAITIHFIKYGPLRKFATLYRPLAVPGPFDLDQLFRLSHRFHVVEHISIFLAKFHVIQVHRLIHPSMVEQPEHAIVVENMARKMNPYLLMLYHFIEMYRAGLAAAVGTHQYSSGPPNEDLSSRVEAEIIRQYNARAIRRLCAMSKFLVRVIARRLRPASYAGVFERFLRGWSKTPASEAQCMELLVIGSLETINQTITLSGFPARIAAIERYLHDSSSTNRKTPDRRLSRSMSIISRKSSATSHVSVSFNPIMQPLDLETVNKISQILPERDDFLNVGRLESLFEPGAVKANQVSTPWAFAAVMMSNDQDDDIEFVAGPARTDVDRENQWGTLNNQSYIWPALPLLTPALEEGSNYPVSSGDDDG